MKQFLLPKLWAVALGAMLVGAAGRADAGVSAITGIVITGTQDVGSFNGVPYVRTFGTVSGIVAPGEKVEGFATLPKDAAGNYDYTSGFEVIAPVKAGASSTILIESENRGSPILHNNLDAIAAFGVPAKAHYPKGLGAGFLEGSGISYGRVSWQTGIAPGVPARAEGVGEVIMRDFARLLGGNREGLAAGAPDLGHFHTLLLGGISQSSWFVNTFIAEGFNADPGTGKAVFAGVLAIDGTGNWLALNRLAAAHHADEAPYFAPDQTPLRASDILHRAKSDPFYVDVANYTDFYRVHASVTDRLPALPTMRRYDWPSPHHPVTSAADAAATFAAKRLGGACNGGKVVAVNPVSYTPYLRTLVIELAHQVGSTSAGTRGLPPSLLFQLGPAPEKTENFNPLAGTKVQVPLTAKDAQPVGGVRFPQVVTPLGRPEPVSLPPVMTTTINGICGNIGQWQPFTAAEAKQRYGSASQFLSSYGGAIDKLVASGYLLASQKPEMLAEAARHYAHPDLP